MSSNQDNFETSRREARGWVSRNPQATIVLGILAVVGAFALGLALG